MAGMQETDRLTLKNGITYLLKDAAAREKLADLLTEVMEKYGTDNPPPYPVTSVNGQTGDVIVGGAVDSVNGQTGAVVLDANDVGALPNTTQIPSKTSDLMNDSGFVNAAGAAAAAPVQSVNGQTGAVTIQSNPGIAVQDTAPTNGELVWIDTDDPGTPHIIPEIDDSSVSASDTWSSQKIRDFIYPVGSIYMSVNSTSPATIFGGTWEQLEDRFLLAAGTTYAAGATGGEAEHTLVKAELPAEQYRIGQDMTALGVAETWYLTYSNKAIDSMQTGAAIQRSATGDWAKTEPLGSGQAHNNMPPYLAVYMWKRTA